MLRGQDATGIAAVRDVWNNSKKEPVVSVYKRALHYVDYAEQKGARRMMDKFSDYYFVIGHTRASTVGVGDDQNAHPFQYGPITLVHNGTVDRGGLIKADEIVDSAHIAATIAEIGETETLEKLEGGYSLVWYNQEDDSLNFARNDRKPMALAFVKGRNEMYFGSEYEALHYVLGRYDIPIEGPIHVPRSGIHYKFFKGALRKFEQEGFKIYTRPTRPATGNLWPEPMVHKAASSEVPQTGKKTDIILDADVIDATTQQKTKEISASSQESTSDTATTTSTLNNPSSGRIAMVDEKLHQYGLKHGMTLILRASTFDSYPMKATNKGKIVFSRIHGDSGKEHDHFDFVMPFASREVFQGFLEQRRLAMKIVNFRDQISEYFEIIVVPDPDMQEVVDKAYINNTEGSKSTYIYKGEGLEEGVITQEALDKENIIYTAGPTGSPITWGEFRKLCSRGCCWCGDPIDPDHCGNISWYMGEVVCEGDTKDPDAQKEMKEMVKPPKAKKEKVVH